MNNFLYCNGPHTRRRLTVLSQYTLGLLSNRNGKTSKEILISIFSMFLLNKRELGIGGRDRQKYIHDIYIYTKNRLEIKHTSACFKYNLDKDNNNNNNISIKYLIMNITTN